MAVSTTNTPDLSSKIGQMIMVGFNGTTTDAADVKLVSQQIHDGMIGGVIFFKHNILSPAQLQKLTQQFKASAHPAQPVLLAVDQEGGQVQRLSADNGFKDFLSAYEVAQKFTPADAQAYYGDMAQMIANNGFNLNLGPIADLHQPLAQQQSESVISGYQRSYSATARDVVDYAGAFVEAHHQHGVLTALKHFPGHGYASHDSHKGMVDITATHVAAELEPFEAMIAQDKADMIMTAHLINKKWDSEYPVTLSPTILMRLLRQQLHYDGVVITDCLNMGAIRQYYNLESIVINAVRAGCDILLFSNTHVAMQHIIDDQSTASPGHSSDHNLVQAIHHIIMHGLQTNQLTEQQIDISYQRVQKIKQKLLPA